MFAVQSPAAGIFPRSARSLGDGPAVSEMSRVPITSLLRDDDHQTVARFYENRREYYRFGSSDMYLFPADDIEAERLDIMHLLIYTTALKSSLHLAQLYHPRRILDVGFGTGYWMFEMAQKHPYAEIIGFDMVQPSGPLPDGTGQCRFRAPVDFLAPRWPIEDDSVDLVHMAQLCGTVPDWASLYRKAYRCLRSEAGQIEHIEIDWTPRVNSGTLPPEAAAMWQWWEWMKVASSAAGRPVAYRDDTEALLEQAGFVEINRKKVKIPLFTYGTKDPQAFALAHNYQMAMGYIGSESFTGFSMALFTRYLNWPPAQVQNLCDQVLQIVGLKGLPLHIELHVWTARKPLT